ncbi:MAG: hypothetical protein AAGF49_04985, partial [Pseudomonadota bacterium]
MTPSDTSDASLHGTPPHRDPWQPVANAQEAVAALCDHYEASKAGLRKAFDAFVVDGIEPPPDGPTFTYPALRIDYAPTGVVPPLSAAFGKFAAPGRYETDIARPTLFADYLAEQIRLIQERYEVRMAVGPSATPIPYPFVMESAAGVDADRIPPSVLARLFPTPDLANIDDRVANSERTAAAVMNRAPDPKPLALFGALRTDYSLQRLRHYTGTHPDDFQQYILFTNYHRYVDEFVELGIAKLREGGRYDEFVAPGNVRVRGDGEADADVDEGDALAPLCGEVIG